LALSSTLGCSGDDEIVSTGDTAPRTDITSPAPATDVTTPEPVATTTSPAPSSTAAQPTTTQPTTTTTSTPTSLPPPTPSSEPVTVLVADVDGVWLLTEESRRLVIDGAVGSAIPDRVGGIVYQNVETGEWRADQYDAPPNTAQWKWVGTGSAEPIRRVLQPGGTGEVVVAPPPDGMVRIVDTAIVDGHPTLAYLRTRHFTITVIDENPWWDSRAAELVVHDLTTGVERVVRTQTIGWEYDYRTPALGEQVVAEAVTGYGDGGNWIELLGFDGTQIDIIDELSDCEYSCDLVADLAPTGEQLVHTQRRPYVSGQIDSEFVMTVVDHRSGSEQIRTDFSLPGGTRVISLDTVDGRTVAATGSQMPPDAATHPVLRRGDRGPWVVVLQQLMSELYSSGSDDTYLTPDGVFGPRTEAAVRAFQTGAGLDEDGIVGTATWSELVAASGSIDRLHDPVLFEADGSFRRLPVLTSGVMPDRQSGPVMTLWSEQ
jgi:hypothetical protein